MEIRYSKHFLNKLEDVFSESDYILRYEKGNFKSGYCIIRDTKVVVVNKFYSLEGKINCLLEIIKSIDFNTEKLNPKNLKLYNELSLNSSGINYG
ncbi:MAG: hypothetical protein KAI29_10660 [Cyclobacteriaceae bacterium]|nr:hypothetical protein [Cyclobacteriaceae bacterium]MCK5701608.1 hypothetical protein [Cyclobacteriaceae bacterium]